MDMTSATVTMDDSELEFKAQQDSMGRFEDQSGREGADGTLIVF